MRVTYINYWEAVVNFTPHIKGRKLLPLSIGHLLNLAAIKSPLIIRNNKPQIDESDIRVAILICSLSFEEGRQLLNQNNVEDQVAKWVFDTGSLSEEDVEIFFKYFDDNMVEPAYFSEHESGKPTGLGYLHDLSITVMSKGNYSLTEARNEPLKQVVMDYYALYQKEGSIRFQTEDQVRFIEEDNKRIDEESKKKE